MCYYQCPQSILDKIHSWHSLLPFRIPRPFSFWNKEAQVHEWQPKRDCNVLQIMTFIVINADYWFFLVSEDEASNEPRYRLLICIEHVQNCICLKAFENIKEILPRLSKCFYLGFTAKVELRYLLVCYESQEHSC